MISRRWRAFLFIALVCGIVLRFAFVEDMEWKEDEAINFRVTQDILAKPFPWVGMNSGVYLANPGLSVWVFMLAGQLARLFGAATPTGLAHAVQAIALAGLCLTIPFALRFVGEDLAPAARARAREPWLWGFALAMVNPFLVLYHRKLWPQGFLPIFFLPMLMGYWRRERRAWAMVWGLFGALIGQVHMSGFFLAFALFAWAIRAQLKPGPHSAKRTDWAGWLIGSVVGAIPLIPWASHVLAHPTHESISGGLWAMLELKFWVFWITDVLGLHLGNPLGLHRGGAIAQISDFARYPIISGQATWICGAAHLILLAVGLSVLSGAILRRVRARRLAPAADPEAARAQRAAAIGFGGLMTLTGVNIRRYYTTILAPLDLAWFAGLALESPRGRNLLGALWLAQCLVSACFVGYIHVNEGSTQGDYGKSYRAVLRENPSFPETPNAPPGQ